MKNKSSKIAILISFIALIMPFLPWHPIQKELSIQYTPDLRAYINSWDIYVGEGSKFDKDRIDDVIEIPLSLCNKSYGLAKDIELTLVYDDGTKTDKILGATIPVLEGGKTLKLPPWRPSILAASKASYLSGAKTFKMKVLFNWKDASSKKYSSVEFFELYKSEAYADSPSQFRFKSCGFYNSINEPEKFKGKASKAVDF